MSSATSRETQRSARRRARHVQRRVGQGVAGNHKLPWHGHALAKLVGQIRQLGDLFGTNLPKLGLCIRGRRQLGHQTVAMPLDLHEQVVDCVKSATQQGVA